MHEQHAGQSETGPTPDESQPPVGEITRLWLRPREDVRRRAAGLAALARRDHRDNLPAPLTPFIGREREVADVIQLVDDHRLVTLTGAPGVGKTRLALRAADELRGRFGDGVWLVELAALAEPSLVASAVARGLGLRDAASRSPVEALAEYIDQRQLLLVLDNCEHLLEACAALVYTLLRACPRLRVLATSREPLGLIGGVAWQVPSLTLPAIASGVVEPGSAGEKSPATAPGTALLGSEAGRLFVERAGAARPGFTLTDREAAAVGEVCRRLDGIPLAIELAAARVRVLSVEEIAARLNHRFALLVGGSRAARPRQRTLRALVDWSHDLLSEPERVLFRRLAVFAGGWTLEAAEAICARDESGETVSTLDLLTGLVDRSLVVAEELGGEIRYRLLETLREYALERLQESGEELTLRRRHLEWVLALAERAAAEQYGPDQVSWLDRLELDHDNLRAALRWSAEAGDVEMGFRLGAALWHFWAARGHANEGRGRLAALVDTWRERPPSSLLAAVLTGAGTLALEVGDHPEARSLLTRGLDVARAANDRVGTARALDSLGRVAHRVGDYAAARALSAESLTAYRALGDTAGIANALHILAFVAYVTGDEAEAEALGQENLALRRELGDRRGIARAVHNLALNAVYHRGDLATARRHYEESLLIFRELGHRAGVAMALDNLRDVLVLERDYHAATVCQKECLDIASEVGDLLRIALAVDGGAMMAAERGHPARAVRLAAAAEQLRKRLDLALEPPWIALFTPKLDAARAALGPASAHVWAEGAAMSMEQAVAYALELGPTADGGSAPALRAAAPGGTSVAPGMARLTPREREIAALVAAGRTNQQIAGQLVVSGRTVEWHVGNILGKLGLTTRAHVAAWARAHGSTPTR